MPKKDTQIVRSEPVLPNRTQQKPEQCYSVELFISQAIEKGLPVETMERLLAMRKQLKEEQAIEAYHRAVSDFQGRCPVIKKNKKVYEKNTTEAMIKNGTAKVRYAYATLDSIIEQIASIMRDCGLSHRIEVLNEDKWITVTCHLIHELGYSQSSTFRVPVDFGAYMSAQQQYASALTYAKRYAFCDVTGILTGDEDNDANALDDAPAATKEAPKAAAPTPVPAQTPTPKPAPVAPKQPPAPAKPVNPDDEKKRTIAKLMNKNGLEPVDKSPTAWADAVKRAMGLDLVPENYDKIIEILKHTAGEPSDEPTTPPVPPQGPAPTSPASNPATAKPEPKSVTVLPPLPSGSMEVGLGPDGELEEVSVVGDAAQQIIQTFGGELLPPEPVTRQSTLSDWREAAKACASQTEANDLIKAMESAGEKKTTISMVKGVLSALGFNMK